jgi:hypothetical protein
LTECRFRVGDRRCLTEYERRSSPKLTLAQFIPETTYGQERTLASYR